MSRQKHSVNTANWKCRFTFELFQDIYGVRNDRSLFMKFQQHQENWVVFRHFWKKFNNFINNRLCWQIVQKLQLIFSYRSLFTSNFYTEYKEASDSQKVITKNRILEEKRIRKPSENLQMLPNFVVPLLVVETSNYFSKFLKFISTYNTTNISRFEKWFLWIKKMIQCFLLPRTFRELFGSSTILQKFNKNKHSWHHRANTLPFIQFIKVCFYFSFIPRCFWLFKHSKCWIKLEMKREEGSAKQRNIDDA